MPAPPHPDYVQSVHCDHPPFWAGDLEAIYGEVQAAKRGEVTKIATSPGGRPVYAVAYGPKEPFPTRANFSSAVGAHDLTAYADKSGRTRPVVVILGQVHGNETNASTGCVNLMHLLETGKDLAGRELPDLLQAAEACRVLVIPVANPDGVARFARGCHVGNSRDEVEYWAQGTREDGSLWGWPGFKGNHPMQGDVGFPGCNLNDAGVNPMHDEAFAPLSQEAPAILRLAREEAPELICGLHAHPTAPAILEPAYVPMYIKREAADLAERLKQAYIAAGIPHAEPFTPRVDGEDPPGPPFNLTSALFHTSGALSFTFECPCGMVAENALASSHEEMLDMQLVLYEECFRYARLRLEAWPGAVC